MSGRDIAIERVAALASPDIAAVHVDPGEVEAPIGFQRTVEPYPGLARQGRNRGHCRAGLGRTPGFGPVRSPGPATDPGDRCTAGAEAGHKTPSRLDDRFEIP